MEKKRGPGYWKLNNSILQNNEYQLGVKEIIRTTRAQFVTLNSRRMLWEMIKINIKQFSIEFCKKNKKESNEKEIKLQESVDRLEEAITKIETNCKEKTELVKERSEKESMLNAIYEQRVKGAHIRSKAEWIEEGEKSSKYFLGLEKQRQSHNVIGKLESENGDIVYKDNDILTNITRFYDKLYTR